MSESKLHRVAWLFIGLAGIAAVALFSGVAPVTASEDHDEVRELVDRGDVVSLTTLLSRDELNGMRVLEVELENKDGRLVYELEVLDGDGRVSERHYDATNGEPLSKTKDM